MKDILANADFYYQIGDYKHLAKMNLLCWPMVMFLKFHFINKIMT